MLIQRLLHASDRSSNTEKQQQNLTYKYRLSYCFETTFRRVAILAYNGGDNAKTGSGSIPDWLLMKAVVNGRSHFLVVLSVGFGSWSGGRGNSVSVKGFADHQS